MLGPRWGSGEDFADEKAEFLNSVAQIPVMQRIALIGLEMLNLAPGQRVLDAGCGTGVFLAYLAEQVAPNGQVIGIDHSAPLIEKALAMIDASGFAASVSIDVGDIHSLPYESAHFDAAHVERVLMHLDHVDLALQEIVRVVKPGGVIVAVEPDWAGIRVDIENRKDLDILISQIWQMPQPDMGLTLLRRFKKLGLVNCRSQPVPVIASSLAQAAAFSLLFEAGAQQAVSHGLLSEAAAQKVLEEIGEMDRSGTLQCVGLMHIVSGENPSGHP